MAKEVSRWECKYCGATKRTIEVAERHELACLGNPDGRNCLLCNHMRIEEHSSSEDFFTWRVKMCAVRRVRCSRATSARCQKFERQEDWF